MNQENTVIDALTPKEVAAELGRSTITVYRWIWSGRLQAEKVGGDWLVTRAQLRRAFPITYATA